MPTNKSTITHQEFMDMLAPAWPKDTSKENILAALKRSSICVNARAHNHTYLYVRPAGDKEVSVQRVRLPADASFLRPAAGERYIQYRHGNKDTLTGNRLGSLHFWKTNLYHHGCRLAWVVHGLLHTVAASTFVPFITHPLQRGTE